MGEDGGKEIFIRTIECTDLLRVFGRAVYMKIDIEANSVDCLESLHAAHVMHHQEGTEWLPPMFLSLEVEAPDLAYTFHERLQALGYSFYKVCRQYIFTP